MAYDDETLWRIYNRTRGRCHLCWRKVYFTNYALPGRRGAWEVEHGLPRAKGGGDHGNNLRPAHIVCNRSKGTMTSRTVRGWHGRTRAPLSSAQHQQARERNAVRGAAVGGLAGLRLGPAGAVLVGLAGAIIGYHIAPE